MIIKGVCDFCTKPKRIWFSSRFKQWICCSCNRDICDLCGNPGQVAIRLKNKKAICNNCFQRERNKNEEKHEICAKCERLRPVNTRNKQGIAICQSCNKQKGWCAKCKQWKIIRVKKRHLCGSCDEKRRRNASILHKSKVLSRKI